MGKKETKYTELIMRPNMIMNDEKIVTFYINIIVSN